LARPNQPVQITRDATEARWARFSNFRSVDLLNLRPHHRARTLTANPAPFYTAWVMNDKTQSEHNESAVPPES